MPLIHSLIISFLKCRFIWAQNKSVLERAKMSQLFTLILTVTYIVIKLINHNAVEHIKSIF